MKFTIITYNEHCPSKAWFVKAKKELHWGCLTDPACSQATSWVRRSGHPHPCTQSAAAFTQLLPTQGCARDGAFHWLPREFFFSVFLCSIFTLRISLDMVSSDLFYNTRILSSSYCIFPPFLCFTLSVLPLIIVCMQKIWETSLVSPTFPNNKLKRPGGKIIIRHPYKVSVYVNGPDYLLQLRS